MLFSAVSVSIRGSREEFPADVASFISRLSVRSCLALMSQERATCREPLIARLALELLPVHAFVKSLPLLRMHDV
jgi:hypothetical protein